MRPLTLITVLSMLMYCSSCVPTWQYITLDSREVTKDTLKAFTWENDTLELIYWFNGYGGPSGCPSPTRWTNPCISIGRSPLSSTGARLPAFIRPMYKCPGHLPPTEGILLPPAIWQALLVCRKGWILFHPTAISANRWT